MLRGRRCQLAALTLGPGTGSVSTNAETPSDLRMTNKKSLDLEKSLAELESLVEELESGDLPLEQAMKKFEEGIKLTRGCQAALKDAEQRVEILLKSAGGDEVVGQFQAED